MSPSARQNWRDIQCTILNHIAVQHFMSFSPWLNRTIRLVNLLSLLTPVLVFYFSMFSVVWLAC